MTEWTFYFVHIHIYIQFKNYFKDILKSIESPPSPTPEFKSPARPKLFVMDETPYFGVLRRVLNREEHPEPLLLTKGPAIYDVRRVF